MSEVWGSLTRLMASDFPVLYADFLRGCDPVIHEQAGIFVPYEPRELADCPECDEMCPIEILQDRDGKDELYCVCMDHGWSLVDPLDQRRWWLHWEPIVEQFVAAMGIKGTMTPIVPDFVWKLGRHNRRDFLFIRCCWEEHIKMLTAELAKHPNSIFVTLTPGAVERLSITLPNRAFSLEETAELDDDARLQVDLEKIEAALGPENKKTTRATPRRAVRVSNIEKLVAEMEEHCRAAKDYYYAFDCIILPRPTQKELAKRTGLRQNDVSRCLSDPNATVLQLLWKECENEKYIANHY